MTLMTLILVDNPAVNLMLILFVAGGILAGLARLVPSAIPSGLVIPLLCLGGYVQIYDWPALPPVGATAKIPYIIGAATLLGLLVDHLFRSTQVKRAAFAVWPLVIIGWIGQTVFADASVGLIVAALALWAAGSFSLWRLDVIATTAVENNGGTTIAIGVLTALLVGFAPVALNGGGSSSLIVCLGYAAGFAAVALWDLIAPRRSFSAASLFAAASTFFAIVDKETLITREIDYLALCLLLPVLYSGQIGARLLLPQRMEKRTRQISVEALTCIPLVLVVAVLFRHPNPFPLHKEVVMRNCVIALSVVAAFAVTMPAFAESTEYEIDTVHTHAIFNVMHLGFARMWGVFPEVSGKITLDPENVAGCKVDITIKTATIDTQFVDRNKDMRGADWFNVNEFPTIHYVSTSCEKKDDKSGVVTAT